MSILFVLNPILFFLIIYVLDLETNQQNTSKKSVILFSYQLSEVKAIRVA